MSPALAGGFFTTQQPGEPFPFFKIFFWGVGTIFKVFIEFVTILLVFYMGVFLATTRHVGSLFLNQGSNPHFLQ